MEVLVVVGTLLSLWLQYVQIKASKRGSELLAKHTASLATFSRKYGLWLLTIAIAVWNLHSEMRTTGPVTRQVLFSTLLNAGGIVFALANITILWHAEALSRLIDVVEGLVEMQIAMRESSAKRRDD